MIKIVSRYEFDGGIYRTDQRSPKKDRPGYRDLSSQGFGCWVLLIERRKARPAYSVSDENNLIFLGFIAFTDPIKETAGESIELLRRDGIKLKILTGDSEIVASKVCDQLGFQVYQYRRGRNMMRRPVCYTDDRSGAD